MTSIKYVLLMLCLKVVQSKVSIDITGGLKPGDVIVKYSGANINVVSDEDIRLFKIEQRKLKNAAAQLYGKKPTSVYLKNPTPWGDLYHEYKWEQVTKVLTVKSATVKSISNKPVVVSTQNLNNPSNKTSKATASITQTVENTITTSWSRTNELTISQEFEYDVNVIFEKATTKVGLSYTVSWGKSEEKSETVTVGSTTGVEVELGPGQSATAVLTANRGYVEVDVVYSSFLRGNVALNYKKKLNGHHFWGPPVEKVMKSGGIKNEVTAVETIKIGFYSDASLTVYDGNSGKPL